MGHGTLVEDALHGVSVGVVAATEYEDHGNCCSDRRKR
jgi:hypothetical protein